jgi:antitoxin ParD1/3/4
MNVSLTPELEQLVAEKVASGMYTSASEVVREALRLLKERDELRLTRLEPLRQEIRLGLADLEQGRSTAYDDDTLPELTQKVQIEGRRRRQARATDGIP